MTAKPGNNKNWSILYTREIISYSIFSAVNSAIMIAIPVQLGFFIDALIYGGYVLSIFTLLFCTALLNLIFNMFLKKIIFNIARQQEQKIQIQLLEAFQSQRPAIIDGYRNGEIAIKFYRDAGAAGQFIFNIYPQLLNATAGIILALLMVFCKNPRIGVFILFFLPLTLLALFPYKSRFSRINHSIRSMYDRSINGIFEFMHIYPYLKVLAADPPYLSCPKSKFSKYKKLNSFNDRTAISFEFINRLILFIGEYGILGIAGWFALKKMIPVGDVVVFQVLFLSVLNSFSGFFQLIPAVETTRESIHSINELLNSEETEDIESGEAVSSANGDIVIQQVSFAYPGSDRIILQNFSCHIKGGTTIVVTGANGTGKTTFLRLLMGYLEPQSGSITIAGKNLVLLQKKSFRRRIASVFQDSLLITGTLRDNITLKNRDYTEKDIAEAIRLSGADSIVKRMPNGLEHRVGCDRGELSGGERQKIAIARALIRKPDILIFDEVTNHLDYQSRIMMHDLILSLRGKATILMVSHDPELVKLCDQKINLDS